VTGVALIALIVRCGLVLLFLPFSAMDKVFNFAGAVGQAQQVFKPRWLAAIVLMTGLAIEIFCSLGIISGVADRAAAFVMAGYCVMTAVLYKPFWAQGDFWSAADGKGRGLFWDFLKNLSLGAGFLLIVVGPDGRGLVPFVSAPLASSHPYSAMP